MNRIVTATIAATLGLGAALTSVEPVSAMPLARPSISEASPIEQVRHRRHYYRDYPYYYEDDWDWRRERAWRHDRRDWRRSYYRRHWHRGYDWRRDYYRGNGIYLEFRL
ncbi:MULTISPECIES: hypothetical protein [unclassified Sinorhizobium]|uniref:hypothetical protein n=1 Tax=unclassified Sinorhizobium TaxID=2613772 RepID=UPI00352411E3